MSEEHDYDLATDLPAEKLDEYDVRNPVEAAKSVASGDPTRELLPLLGGGVLLLSALRSLKEGKLRAIPIGAAGAGLLGYGLRNQRADDAPTFETSTEEIEGGTEGKDVSDEAGAATGRLGAEDVDESGEIPESVQEETSGERIEFTDDADRSRTKPEDVDDDSKDPRFDEDEDEEIEVDVSNASMAEEASEATGPDPEQAQPSQTDATEPEETPEEDASDMKVEPDEDAEDDETEADEETEAGDETDDEETEAGDETDDEDETEE